AVVGHGCGVLEIDNIAAHRVAKRHCYRRAAETHDTGGGGAAKTATLGRNRPECADVVIAGGGSVAPTPYGCQIDVVAGEHRAGDVDGSAMSSKIKRCQIAADAGDVDCAGE